MSKEDSEKALRHRAELLSSLPRAEAFQALADESRRKEQRMIESLMQRLLHGESLDSMQRQIDYDRGFIDGMKYLASAVPAGAESRLQRSDLASYEAEQPEEDYWNYGQPE